MTNTQETKMTLEDRIEQAREAAHQAGENFGKTSPEFAVAMEILEELHQESGPTERAAPKLSRTLLFGQSRIARMPAL
jgi:hypothetical protein